MPDAEAVKRLYESELNAAKSAWEHGPMTRLKIGIVTALMVAPFIFLIGVGSFHLYQTGWSFIAWWPMAASFALAYLLAWWWARSHSKQLHATIAEDDLPTYWTERDRAAWMQVAKYVATCSAAGAGADGRSAPLCRRRPEAGTHASPGFTSRMPSIRSAI